MFVKFLTFLLKHKRLSKEDLMLLTGQLLQSIGSLPLNGILTLDAEGTLLLRGTKLEYEKAAQLRESADAILNQPAWKLIKEQVLYEAVQTGFITSQNLDQVLFSRAAVWFGKQEEDWLELLAGTATDA